LLSVGARVTEVDASEATAATNVRFVAKNNGAETNVTYKGGLANDYVEFEVGNINATGGTGNDTFAFINTGFNSTFTTLDSINGGDGTDAIQLGVNGIGAYDVDWTEFNSKTGIDVLDLRGATNKVTLADAFVAASDAGLTVRTTHIVQTSAESAANPVGGSTAEDASVNTINLTKLTANRGITFEGGSGSDRLVLNEQSFTSNAKLAGGDNNNNAGPNVPAVIGDYDTLTVVDNAILSRGDLSQTSGFEGIILVKSDDLSGREVSIELTEAFILANTKGANDATISDIDDRTFQIGTANAANANALGAGDTVTIDISDLFAAGVYKTSLGARGIDATTLVNAGVTINYIFNGAPAAAAQIAAATHLDAVGQNSVIGSAAVPAVNRGIIYTSSPAGANFNVLGTSFDDTFTLSQPDIVQGGAGTDTVNFNAGSAGAQVFLGAGADIVNLNVIPAAGFQLNLAAGGTVNIANLGAFDMNTVAANFVFTGATTVNTTVAQTGLTLENGANVATTASAGGNFVLGTGGQSFTGTGAADFIVGDSTGNDNITSGAGDDLIFIGAGNDVVNAGAGNDIVSVVLSGTDTINFGGEGSDQLVILNTDGINALHTAQVNVANFGAGDVLTLAAGAGNVATSNGVFINNATGVGAPIVTNLGLGTILEVAQSSYQYAGTPNEAAVLAHLNGTMLVTGAANAIISVVAYDGQGNAAIFQAQETNGAASAFDVIELIGIVNVADGIELSAANFS